MCVRNSAKNNKKENKQLFTYLWEGGQFLFSCTYLPTYLPTLICKGACRPPYSFSRKLTCSDWIELDQNILSSIRRFNNGHNIITGISTTDNERWRQVGTCPNPDKWRARCSLEQKILLRREIQTN